MSSLLMVAPAIAAPTISVDDVTVTEGDSGAKFAVFTVSLSAPSAVDVGFMVGTAEVGAIGNDDFQHYYSSPYTIPAGQTTYTLNLVVFGDTVVETDETFEVLLENVSNATVAKGVGIGTIVNDDGGASPTLSVGDLWIAEGNSGARTANFTVQLSQAAATDVSFSVATANGTASAGSDYTAVNLSNQVIPAGQLRKTIAVTLAGDSTIERDENFRVNLSSVTGAGLGRSQGQGTIGNDDGVSAVKISVGDAYVQERQSGPQVASFTVMLSQPAASTVTFDIRTEDSSASAGSDYVALALTGQTIAAGLTSKTFSVTVNGDTLPEGEEHFIVTLSNVSTNASVQYADPHGVGVIPNDDAVLSISDASVQEGDGGTTDMVFTVSLSAPVSNQVQFHYVTCDGTATVAGADYWATGSNYFTYFPGGATSMQVRVTVNGDFEQEADETFCVDLVDVGGAAVADGHAVGTILNDDVPVPTISVGDVAMAEGDSGFQGMYFPLTLSSPAKNTIFVNVHTEACGNAQPDVNVPYTPGDYTDTSYTNYSIYAGSTTAQVYVSVRGDTVFEPDEQFCLKLDSANGANLGTVSGVGTILNDDTPPMLSVTDVSIPEGPDGGHAVMYFAVILSKPATTDVTFDIATDYGTATPDVDFVSASQAGLKIPAGNTYTLFQVDAKGDADVEGDETFTVNLRNVTGVAVAKAQGLGTLLNDDKAELRIADASFTEGDDGNSTARFIVTLSHPMPTPVHFDIATGGGAASAGVDYIARSKPGMMIDAGRTRAVFEVTLLGDTTDEPDEDFGVAISNIQGATDSDNFALGTVLDDDAAAATAIAQVQGTGATSPLVGASVSVEGVVTATAGEGFFLQSQEGGQDGDDATSEAIFVQGGTVAVGDRVRASGRVLEVALGAAAGGATRTQLAANDLVVLGQGQALPRAVELRGEAVVATVPAGVALERLEGMRVAVPQMAVIAPTGGSIDERSGRVRGDGRFHGAVRAASGGAERIRIVSAGQSGAVALSADRGDLVTGLVGVLAQGNGSYELLPDPSADIHIVSRARPAPVTAPLASEATLASVNLRRFLDDTRQGSEVVPAADLYATRLAKTANMLCGYARAPAIVAVQDIESGRALEDLAAAANSRAGNVLFPEACDRDPRYLALRDPRGPGSRVGLLVSRAPVRAGVPRVDVRSLASKAAAETFAWRDGGREPLFESPPLLAQVRINGVGGEVLDVALVVAQLGEFDLRSGQASRGWPSRADYLRSRRTAQARALAAVVRAQQRLQPSLPVVVLSDVDALPAGLGLTDLAAQPASGSPYSVIVDGEPRRADRVLLSEGLLAPAFGARVEFARINADFGEDNYADPGVPVRVSDHDPLVLFLRMRR